MKGEYYRNSKKSKNWKSRWLADWISSPLLNGFFSGLFYNSGIISEFPLCILDLFFLLSIWDSMKGEYSDVPSYIKQYIASMWERKAWHRCKCPDFDHFAIYSGDRCGLEKCLPVYPVWKVVYFAAGIYWNLISAFLPPQSHFPQSHHAPLVAQRYSARIQYLQSHGRYPKSQLDTK